MLQTIIDWLGFGARGHSADHHVGHGHHHGDDEDGHGHTHGVIDPTIATTERGIWAIKWSFIILAITAAAQIVVVILTGSVALFADTIHNIGDAATAIPLWIAFLFARKKPNNRFTYGYGKVEDIAGVIIVGLILFSAIVAGWESIDRLLNPRDINYLWAVAFAGIVGFIGNEVVAVFRIRVGREIQSAALIADGYHARVDGLTSLAVVLGSIGVGLGFPLADPIVGLIITVMIFGIVWQSARAVFTRLLDGVDAGITSELRHSIEHVPGIVGIDNVRARWLGHRLHAEADIALPAGATVAEGIALTRQLRETVGAHLPALTSLRIGFTDPETAHAHAHEQGHEHKHETHGHAHEPHGHEHPHDEHAQGEHKHGDHDHPHPHEEDPHAHEPHGHEHGSDTPAGHEHGDHAHPHEPHAHNHGEHKHPHD
jgi:cation diffusion facilitator family transporter